MSIVEFGRHAQGASKKDVDRMAGNLLGKIKSKFGETLPPDFWRQDSHETLERSGKKVEVLHANIKEASTTTIRVDWKNGEGDHRAVLEVMYERPILSIAGLPLWKEFDLSNFTFEVDGEVFSSTQDPRGTETRARRFVESL